MSDDIEWLRPQLAGDVVGAETVDMQAARGLVVGPADILVVVFPTYIGMPELQAHRTRLKETLGDRFVLVSGDDVQLAVINDDQWARGTHE